MRIFFKRVICFFLIVTMLLGNNCVSALASNTDYAAATSQDHSTYNEEVEFIDLADGETAYETDPTAGDGVKELIRRKVKRQLGIFKPVKVF